MQIIKKSVKQLAFDPNNARQHDQKNIDAIKGSLAKFGQQKPIVIDENGVVIAGNGTLQSAKELGWKEIDCVVTELDSFNKTAFALADNRTAELAAWDNKILDDQLAVLMGCDFNITDIGFDLPADIGEEDLPDIADEEKFLTQITFTVHADQKEVIDEAVSSLACENDINKNKNGNALHRMALLCLQKK